MASKVIFWLGIFFLVLFIGSILILSSLINAPKHIPVIASIFGSNMYMGPPCNGCGSGGIEPASSILIGDTNPDLISVSGAWPQQMDISNSDTISLTLTAPNQLSPRDFPYSLSTPVVLSTDTTRKNYLIKDNSLNTDMYDYCYGKNVDESDGMIACTASRTINNLFGSGYKAFASAHLVTTGFNVQLLSSEEQSVSQGSISWNWNIAPKSSGVEVISGDIEFVWKPTTTGGENIVRHFWESPIIITINPPPFFTLGQVSLSSALGAFGTILFGGLSLNGLIEQRKKKNEEKQPQKESQTPDKSNLTQVTSGSHLQLVQKRRAVKLAQRRRNPHQ